MIRKHDAKVKGNTTMYASNSASSVSCDLTSCLGFPTEINEEKKKHSWKSNIKAEITIR